MVTFVADWEALSKSLWVFVLNRPEAIFLSVNFCSRIVN